VTVEADRVYANVRTHWVEPETGVIIKARNGRTPLCASATAPR
jgi:hypothetical protein